MMIPLTIKATVNSRATASVHLERPGEMRSSWIGRDRVGWFCVVLAGVVLKCLSILIGAPVQYGVSTNRPKVPAFIRPYGATPTAKVISLYGATIYF